MARQRRRRQNPSLQGCQGAAVLKPEQLERLLYGEAAPDSLPLSDAALEARAYLERAAALQPGQPEEGAAA